jgi:NADH dehydrogenase
LSALVAAGHQAKCLVRPGKAQGLFPVSKIEWISGDLTEPESWTGALQNQDTVIHLASIHEGPPSAIHRNNVTGTANLISAARLAGVRHFIYLSTITATDKPKLPYSHSCYLAERLISDAMADSCILRATVIVGQDDAFLGGLMHFARRWPFVPLIAGPARFQPIWVEDVVRCLLQTVSEKRFSKAIIPIGGPETLALSEMAQIVQKALGSRKRTVPLPRRPTRTLARALKRLGVRLPFTSAYFLSHGLVAPPGSVEQHFGFRPKTMAEFLPQILRAAGVLANAPAER